MKKKYIIALEDRNVWSCGLPAKTLLLSDVSIFGTDLASVNTGIELTPYTEPDLEQVKRDYDAWYEKGLADAWEAAKKVAYYWIWSGQTSEAEEIFGTDDVIAIFKSYSASEAIEKIRQYEQEKEEIKVGDEVAYKHDKNLKGFVYQVDRHVVRGVTSGAVNFQWIRDTVVKTGRHFPEIAEVLAKMKEGE